MKARALPVLLILALCGLAVVPLQATQRKGKGKEKEAPAQVVDAGSFGVYVGGNRVATETFQIEQRAGSSVTVSELSIQEGGGSAQQRAELHMASNGDLRTYRWQELSPGRAETVVESGDVFMVEKITTSPSEKPTELTHLLPASTILLDDYFFTHRQILLWKYLAMSDCKGAAGGMECEVAPAKFGVFVPRQHGTAMVELAYAGREKVTIQGAERELNRFNMQADGADWAMWLDDAHRLVRVVVPSANVEVLRD